MSRKHERHTVWWMAPEAERAYLADVAERIRSEEGSPPGGWSSPWLSHTPSTLNLLVASGYQYLLVLRLDDQPVWLSTESLPLLMFPYAAALNDSSTMVGRSVSPRDFADMIDDEFAVLHAAAVHTRW